MDDQSTQYISLDTFCGHLFENEMISSRDKKKENTDKRARDWENTVISSNIYLIKVPEIEG